MQAAPSPKWMTVRAELAHECVRVGETQTVTIFAPTDSRVAYGATYSDGSSAMSSTFYGGNKGGVVTKGRWSDTWAIGPGAPPGVVKVDIGGVHALHGVGQSAVSFRLVAVGQAC